MKRIGITPEEWDALSAGRAVVIGRVPCESKAGFKPGDRLVVGKLYQSPLAEVTVQWVVSYDKEHCFTLEVSRFRLLPIRAFGGL